MSMIGSKTEQNLMKAFAGSRRRETGTLSMPEWRPRRAMRQIAALFLETADNERSHALQFFSLLEGGMPEFTASYPAGPVHTTVENLRAAAEGELLEWGTLYPGLPVIAEEEGFKKAAATFRKIAGSGKVSRAPLPEAAGERGGGRVFRKTAPSCGSAANAGTSTRVRRRPRCVRCAGSRRATSRSTARTTRRRRRPAC